MYISIIIHVTRTQKTLPSGLLIYVDVDQCYQHQNQQESKVISIKMSLKCLLLQFIQMVTFYASVNLPLSAQEYLTFSLIVLKHIG